MLSKQGTSPVGGHCSNYVPHIVLGAGIALGIAGIAATLFGGLSAASCFSGCLAHIPVWADALTISCGIALIIGTILLIHVGLRCQKTKKPSVFPGGNGVEEGTQSPPELTLFPAYDIKVTHIKQ